MSWVFQVYGSFSSARLVLLNSTDVFNIPKSQAFHSSTKIPLARFVQPFQRFVVVSLILQRFNVFGDQSFFAASKPAGFKFPWVRGGMRRMHGWTTFLEVAYFSFNAAEKHYLHLARGNQCFAIRKPFSSQYTTHRTRFDMTVGIFVFQCVGRTSLERQWYLRVHQPQENDSMNANAAIVCTEQFSSIGVSFGVGTQCKR